MCYLSGGTPQGSERKCAGSHDKTEPTVNWSYLSGWNLHFAHESQSWGNQGVAFLQRSNNDKAPLKKPKDAVEHGTLCRLYRITFEQFIDVLIQENGGNPHSDNSQYEKVFEHVKSRLETLSPDGEFELSEDILANGWYRRVVYLEKRDNIPVLTFTDTQELPFNKPSLPYLSTIALGLHERFYELSTQEIGHYLCRTSKWTEKETLDISGQAFEVLVEEACKYINKMREKTKDQFNSIRSKFESPLLLRVKPTHDRLENKGQFILQVHSDLLQKKTNIGEYLKKNEVVAVASWHGNREYRVSTLVLPDPIVDDCPLQPHEIALDAKIRVAIGASLGDWVEIIRLCDQQSTSFFERIIGTQPQLMRTHKATFEDMEINVARIPETTFQLIGAEPGATVAISSTYERVHVRTAILTAKIFDERFNQRGNKKGIYDNPVQELELERLPGHSDQSDLPPIFIDEELRQRLKIEPGDPVRVVRDSVNVFFSKIYVIAFPILLGLISAVLSYKHKNWTETGARILLFFAIVFATFGVVIWEVRSKFRRR